MQAVPSVNGGIKGQDNQLKIVQQCHFVQLWSSTGSHKCTRINIVVLEELVEDVKISVQHTGEHHFVLLSTTHHINYTI